MKKILIVDDEPQIRQLISKYAKIENYEVTEAENGMEALRLCKRNEFDIIIL